MKKKMKKLIKLLSLLGLKGSFVAGGKVGVRVAQAVIILSVIITISWDTFNIII